jgi:hypothetical protein
LPQTKKLKDLSDLGVNTVDTSDSNHKGQFGFIGNIEIVVFPCFSLQAHQISLLPSVFLNILFSTFENNASLLVLGLFE